MNRWNLLLIMCLIWYIADAQVNSQQAAQAVEAMEQLSFLAGEWSGSGWQMNEQGQKMPFNQTEKIEFLGEGHVLLIQGRGMTQTDSTDGEVIHNAVAMITHNEGNVYHFDAYAAGRGKGNHRSELVEPGHFQWYMDTPRGQIRYSITVDQEGQWKETGEFNTGSSWFPFFEMILERK